MRVLGVDITPVLHEEFDHFVVTCTDSVVKGRDSVAVRLTRNIHLGGGDGKGINRGFLVSSTRGGGGGKPEGY